MRDRRVGKHESSLLFFRVVKRSLVNGSSLLSEESERGSFRLHPLIRQYVRFDASGTERRLSQDIALRAVRETILQEQTKESCTVVSMEQTVMRGILAIAPHAMAVVQDQVDAREVAEKEEQKFMEVTEPVADRTVSALLWSGRAVEAETLCTSLLDFLCWLQMEPGTRACVSRFMDIFKPTNSPHFIRRKRF